MNRKARANRTVKAFTLVELLVVIAIIAILAAVLTPAVTEALTRGKMTGVMQNGRSMYLALFAKDLEDPVFQTGSPYPKSSQGPFAGNAGVTLYDNSTEFFLDMVTNKTLSVDFSFFSAPGVQPYRWDGRGTPNFMAANNAWCITADASDSTPDNAPLLFTRNIDCGTRLYETPKLLPEEVPFGRKGAVVVTKGGSSFIVKENILEDQFNPGVVASNYVLRP